MAERNFSDDRFTVLTGGPGSGKTSVIEELRRRGYAGTQEAGRAIIKDQQLIGGNALHTGDRVLFAELMLGWEIRSYRMAQDDPAPAVFFDRGIPEFPGYYRLIGLPVPAHVAVAARLFRYRPGSSSRRRGRRSTRPTPSAARTTPRRLPPARRSPLPMPSRATT